MFLVFQFTGSMTFTDITASAVAPGSALTQPYLLGMPVAFWAAVLLFIGACGKSAQIPLYVWLPDAMAGPTPVSALIHAATMVTAGVYMVARLHALYMLAPAAMAIVALTGAVTAVFAAIIGFAQNDFKKVLAYSTVSQLGFMFAGVGTGNFEGGVFHLFTHAFFKAGLFLCAGSVMHAMSGSGDITKMGGLRRQTPWTHWVFFVCWLAICGVPIFAGFFSKDSIIALSFATPIFERAGLAWVGPLVSILLMLAALGTAFYMSRLYFLVFSGPSRADAETQHHIHESPSSMVGPLVVLAIGAALSGLLGIPGGLFEHQDWNLLEHQLEPVLGPELEISHMTEWAFMGLSVAVALGGIGLAYVFYGGGYRQPAHSFARQFPGLVKTAQNKFYVDELYDMIFIRPLRRFAQGLFRFFDRIVIDKVLVEGSARVVDVVGRLTRRLQSGDSQLYMAVFAIGVAGVVYFATKPPVPGELKFEVNGMTVTADARRGGHMPPRDLQYVFDFDDGKLPVQQASPELSHTYSQPGTYKVKVQVKDPRWGTSDSVSKNVTVH
jgi:NADH-quinone oxidoreductase subunit L